MGFLSYDSEVMQSISRAADYMILNVLCLLLCMPIVTAGAALTAKYYVSMKLVRGEEPAVCKAFFKSFKENFKQATILWIIMLFVLVLLGLDWFLMANSQQGITWTAFQILLLVMTVLALMSTVCVFPLLARFHLTNVQAVRSAVLFSVLHFPQMLLVLLSMVLPYYIGYHYMEWFLLIWVICTGVSLYLVSKMYVKAFAKLENGKEGAPEAESMEETDGMSEEKPAEEDVYA